MLLCVFSVQVEELKSRLTEAEKQTINTPANPSPAKRNSLLSNGVNGSPPALPEKPLHRTEVQKAENTGAQMRDSGPATGVKVCFYNLSERMFPLVSESTFCSVVCFMFLKCSLCRLPQALMDILQQDRREAAEQRQELCDIITRLRGELQSTEEHWDKVRNDLYDYVF